jgi:transposase
LEPHVVDSFIKKSIDDHISYLDVEIKSMEVRISAHIKKHSDLNDKANLLLTIPGIGTKTIHRTLAFLSEISHFKTAKKVAAYPLDIVGLRAIKSLDIGVIYE